MSCPRPPTSRTKARLRELARKIAALGLAFMVIGIVLMFPLMAIPITIIVAVIVIWIIHGIRLNTIKWGAKQ